MRYTYILIAILAISFSNFAQIGYQISLLDNASGTPRANETVSITVQITNCEGAAIYSQTSSETTNDFGVLSLTLGNDQTFANVDWTKLPFFVSATVNGVLIGRSQLLSVPVAECALNLRSCKDKIVGRTLFLNTTGKIEMSFGSDTVSYIVHHYSNLEGDVSRGPFKYVCYGNCIAISDNSDGGGWGMIIYDPETDRVYGSYLE